MRNRNADSLVTYQASADAVSAVFVPSALSPLVDPNNIFAPAVTELLMFRCPGAEAG